MPVSRLRLQPALFPPEGRQEAPPPSSFPKTFAHTIEKNRDRKEHRTLESTSNLTVCQQWPGLKQGFRIEREITRNEKKTFETVHGITSRSPEQADAKQLLHLSRDHWKVENSLHYVRDVTLGEDACRVRSENAPQALAACRNLVVFLVNDVDAESRLAAIQLLAARSDEAIDLLNSQK